MTETIVQELVSDHEVEVGRTKIQSAAQRIERLRLATVELQGIIDNYWDNYFERTADDYRALIVDGVELSPRQVVRYVNDYWAEQAALMDLQLEVLADPDVDEYALDRVERVTQNFKGRLVEQAYQFRLALIIP